MADIEVEFVTVERRFWSGTATMVVAKTTEGEIGIQSGHEPLLGELDAGGTVTVYTDEGKKVAAFMHQGKPFNTVIGPISFDKKGDITRPDYVIYEWKKGPSGTIDYTGNEIAQ